MCLTLPEKITEPSIATEDITVYKHLNRGPKLISHIKPGTPFKGKIHGRSGCLVECEGKVSLEFGEYYFCTDDPNLKGSECDEKYGYEYSWVFANTLRSIIIDEKEFLELGFKTPYRSAVVEIGKTYHSELIRENRSVHVALHSFASVEAVENGRRAKVIVECIIPKGSKYYRGAFESPLDSYASDTLTYIKIIKE